LPQDSEVVVSEPSAPAHAGAFAGAGAPHVLVVGSLNIDLVVHAPRLPRPGETLTGDGFATDQGGKGANQAVAAARMGVRVAMLGRVGDDDHGRRLLAALQRDGIDTRAVGVDDARPTGVALITVASDGENSIVVVPGANHGLRTAHADAAFAGLTQARVVVAQLEIPQETVFAALQQARSAGAITLLNAAPAAALSAAQLACVQWLVVNEGEAAGILGTAVDTLDQARAAAQALRARGPGDVVITLGADGLVHAGADGVTHHATQPVQAVDTTGAGDTFVGVLAAGLAQGWPAAQALRWGQAAAAIAVTRRGAQSAMPTRAEVMVQLAGETAR
jgi:ribokinase